MIFKPRIFLITSLAMVAFAGNSLLCRAALKGSEIDAASFTAIRLLSGALTLGLIALPKKRGLLSHGNGNSMMALFTYAGAFSFAYLSLSAASGALMLFGSVQATMIGFGLWKGERFNGVQVVGLVMALGGLMGLLLPGLDAPPAGGAALMIIAGIAWGIYSLRGRGEGDPVLVTAGNFIRAVPLALGLGIFSLYRGDASGIGIAYAVGSGALASGIGYAIWYTALPKLRATSAATVQLSVPIIASFGGVVALGEPITMRLTLASVAILGGIACVTLKSTPAD